MSTLVINPTFHHVNLKTNRLQAMIDWYRMVVGMSVTHQFDGGAWLSNDSANHRLALLADPEWEDDPDKRQHTGIHHTAYEYQSIGELLDTYVRLRAEGVEPHCCLDHGMTISFYYVDPDDNSVELQCDAFGDWEQSKAFMRESALFADDPIGRPVDPDRIMAACDAGANPPGDT